MDVPLPPSGMVLRPGDTINFVVTASDPEGLPLEHGIFVSDKEKIWQASGEFQLTLTDMHISKSFGVMLSVRSSRSYHAKGDYDDSVVFVYDVLPARTQ